MILATDGGSVELYQAGNKKFETTSQGANLEGNGSDHYILDIHNTGSGLGSQIRFRNDHDASANIGIIGDTTGDLRIYTEKTFKVMHGSDDGIKSLPNGEVQLYHDGGERLNTTANGIELGLSQGSHPAGAFGGGYYSDIIINNCGTASGADGGSGVVLLSGNASWGGFIFADNDEDQKAYIKYNHSADTMYFGSDGADRVLLDSTAFYPNTNNAFDLGSSSKRFRNIYTADLHCSNKGSSNDVDGTWGDYTIQEGESDLFLINNRNGKKYKFNLTEVS